MLTGPCSVASTCPVSSSTLSPIGFQSSWSPLWSSTGHLWSCRHCDPCSSYRQSLSWTSLPCLPPMPPPQWVLPSSLFSTLKIYTDNPCSLSIAFCLQIEYTSFFHPSSDIKRKGRLHWLSTSINVINCVLPLTYELCVVISLLLGLLYFGSSVKASLISKTGYVLLKDHSGRVCVLHWAFCCLYDRIKSSVSYSLFFPLPTKTSLLVCW